MAKYKIWKKKLSMTLNRLNELAVIQMLNRLYCNVDLGSHEPVTYLGSKVKPISTPTSHTQTSTQTSQDNIRHVCLARDWINFKCHDTSGMSHRGHGTFNLNFECSNLLLDMHSSIVWHCCGLTFWLIYTLEVDIDFVIHGFFWLRVNPIPTRWGRNQPSHCISRDQVG